MVKGRAKYWQIFELFAKQTYSCVKRFIWKQELAVFSTFMRYPKSYSELLELKPSDTESISTEIIVLDPFIVKRGQKVVYF